MRQTRTVHRRWLVAVGMVTVSAVALTGCAQSQRGDQGGGGKTGGTLNFGLEGQPKLFDPFYANEGATFTVTHQIFNNLVTFKPGTTELTGDLASSYETAADGLSYTFHLRAGVKFTDGTTFDADAVCKNFTRWYNQTGAGQSEAVSQYWVDNVGGFADGKDPSLYKGCQAKDTSTAVVSVTKTSSQFLDLLAEAPFAIQSPTAMDKGKANEVKQQGDSFTFPDYSNAPVGTGPFKLAKNDVANKTIELVRNEDYWGEKAKLDKIIFKVIGDETVRKQELQSGGIDGYNLPSPADWSALETAGYQVLKRPVFNVLYLGVGQKNNASLRDLKVRQALAYAINRDQLVKTQLPAGAKVATQFQPENVDGYAKDVQAYNYDLARAKQLLNEAGASKLSVNFYWPSEVTRPYMPNPQNIYTAIANDLKAAGITVNAITKPWNGGYLTDVDQGKADLFLLGWTGDIPAPANWTGTFFASTTNRFGIGNSPWGQQLVDSLKAADAEPDTAKRTADYQDINKKLMSDYLPGVPLSHSPPAIVFKKGITGFVPSPMTSSEESYASVSLG
ncbi:ABC transporter substrate-binding protein [Kutzneria viridogrisea]|uniref:Dipeptide ABC transporter substrate-binding protein n=2 Tax=Kutzneria TaxID=43356 RepID=W5W631_9PSEU|nr:ABC transporter substrate-binding protein [Kutzneria albida]AHH93619.1 dipeptide ABC transporter substrate-binding protein [Kutzneria albida DSM 43870]MBA8928997.1 peptide/nickel transport system substrate-binding protein [Kutzneria viridogrisea]